MSGGGRSGAGGGQFNSPAGGAGCSTGDSVRFFRLSWFETAGVSDFVSKRSSFSSLRVKDLLKRLCWIEIRARVAVAQKLIMN